MRSTGRGLRVLMLVAPVVGTAVSCGRGGPDVRLTPVELEGRSGGPAVRALSGGWVEARVSVVASDEESPAQARARTLARARAAACEFVSGVTVRSQVISFQSVRGQDAGQLVQTLDAVSSEAVVVDERVVSEQVAPLSEGGFLVDLTLQARVVNRRGTGADPGFSVEVRLPRERLLHGEDVTIAVRPTRRARVYVFDVAEDGATMLLPNGHRPDTVVEANEWLTFPGPELLARGVRVQARLPEGRRRASESLLVVALRGDRRFKDVGPGPGQVFRQSDGSGAGSLLYEVLGKLGDLAPSEWAIAQAAYEVWSR